MNAIASLDVTHDGNLVRWPATEMLFMRADGFRLFFCPVGAFLEHVRSNHLDYSVETIVDKIFRIICKEYLSKLEGRLETVEQLLNTTRATASLTRLLPGPTGGSSVREDDEVDIEGQFLVSAETDDVYFGAYFQHKICVMSAEL